MLSRPTQLLIQMQWWSMRAMHLRQRGRLCATDEHPGWGMHGGSMPRAASGFEGDAVLSMCRMDRKVLQSSCCLLVQPSCPVPAAAATPLPMSHLPQVRQCLERAGQGTPHVQHSLASYT